MSLRAGLGVAFAGLVGCARGPEDPRAALVLTFAGAPASRVEAAVALREGRDGEACRALRARLAADSAEAEWSTLLVVAARDPNCLPVVDAERLATWGRGREGWADAVGEWDAAQARPVDLGRLGPGARLRVALRGDDQAVVVRTAEEVLRADPTDPFACAVLVRDAIERGELEEAAGHCSEVHTPAVGRLRAQALDEAGRVDEAVAAYERLGLTVHAGAILVQERPGPDAESRLAEPVPPAALHRGWGAVLRGVAPSLEGLDASPEATMLRALAGDVSAREELAGIELIEARVLRARLEGIPDLLATDLAASPTSEVLLRADLGIRLERGLDLGPARARLAALDPDHVRLTAHGGRREAPWRALVPWTWADLAARADLAPSAASDEVGERWREAQALPAAERAERFAELQEDHPTLRGLARVRAGGSLLDGPPALR